MRKEIEKHWGKLKRISKLPNSDLEESRFRVFTKLNFINEQLIPEKTWLAAEALTIDIDVDDLDFIALTNHLKGRLWTGDKKLYNGLKKKNFKKIINLSELVELRKSSD